MSAELFSDLIGAIVQQEILDKINRRLEELEKVYCRYQGPPGKPGKDAPPPRITIGTVTSGDQPDAKIRTDVFRDVLVVKVDSPEVTLMEWTPEDGWVESELTTAPKFTAGDRIRCHARGAFSVPVDPQQCNDKPEHSVFVVAVDAEHARLVKNEGSLLPTLIFKREDIEIDKELLYDEETGS